MKTYTGLDQNDYEIIKFAIQNLQIKGAEAFTIANLLMKIDTEIDLIKSGVTNINEDTPPNTGDLYIKDENPSE